MNNLKANEGNQTKKELFVLFMVAIGLAANAIASLNLFWKSFLLVMVGVLLVASIIKLRRLNHEIKIRN